MRLTEAPLNRRDAMGAEWQGRNRTARSVWSASSLLALSGGGGGSKAGASSTHSTRFARQFIHNIPRSLQTAVAAVGAERFSFRLVKGTVISEHDVSMGGHSQARRIGAAAVWSLLLGAGLAGAEPADRQGLFPPHSTVVLVAGVP